MTSEQIAWLAGLLEGEASFSLHAGGHPKLDLEMSDEDVIAKAANLIGARLRPQHRTKNKPHYKATWRVNICGSKAIPILEKILPFMGMRRTKKIEEILHPPQELVLRLKRNHADKQLRRRGRPVPPLSRHEASIAAWKTRRLKYGSKGYS